MKPEPAPVPGYFRELALATMRHAKFPILATADGDQPRVRPVSPVRSTDFTVYVASFRRSHKTASAPRTRRRALLYDEGHDQVRITGEAEVVTDAPTLGTRSGRAIPSSANISAPLDNPELIIYRIRPLRVRFMREWALDYHEVVVTDTIRVRGPRRNQAANPGERPGDERCSASDPLVPLALSRS